MPVTKIEVEEFVKLAGKYPVIDVRSPGEFIHAHIPGAYSLPLFTDEERKVVGTLYKQESREKATKKGLEYFGVKMVKMLEEAEALVDVFNTQKNQDNAERSGEKKTVLVHCWRGGMRSAGVAWLLDLYGFKVYSLAGGYKVFRNWVLEQFENEYNLKVIGGYTGSGKTLVLQQLNLKGKNVVDLENLANHKGSAFGNIDMPPQPTQEMFENQLAIELSSIVQNGQEASNNNNPSSTEIYVEDESQRIGNVNVPITLWKRMRSSPLIFLDIPFEERLKFIVQDYGKGHKEKLVNAIIRIKKRLGGLETKTAINFLLEDNLEESFSVLLHYYDKQYKKGLENRDNWKELTTPLVCDTVDAAKTADKILMTEKEKINA